MPQPDRGRERGRDAACRRGRERGDVSLRVIAAVALVTALIWAVPMVVFGRDATPSARVGDPAAVPEPDTSVPRSVIEPTGPIPVVAPQGPIGQTEDLQAQATLNKAIRVAQAFYAENGTFSGFGPEVAGGYDPTVTFTSGPAGPGVVSVRGLGPETVVFVASTGDGYLCAAAQGEIVSFGRADAGSPSRCTGGWG